MKKRYALICLALLLTVAAALMLLPKSTAETSRNPSTQDAEACGSIKIDYCYNMPPNGADSAIVIDAKSGSVLFEKNADMIRGMASTTKIMTALVAIESCDADTEFTIPKEAVGIEGSSVYLQEGERLTLRELLYCLMLESGNDAATAIALCVGGSMEGFLALMNGKAAEMGLRHTNFTNPHGLSDYSHYTTARELAAITAEAMKYPIFCEIVATKSYKVRRNNAENGRLLTNHNKLLNGYEGCIGVKTGYTDRDGKCLVSAAKRDGLTVIAVTLKDSSPTATHKALLDGAFANFQSRKIASRGEIKGIIPLLNGESDFAEACNTEDIFICLPKGAEHKTELILPESVTAPIEANEIIAKARVISGGKEVYIIQLETQTEFKEKEKNFWEKIFG